MASENMAIIIGRTGQDPKLTYMPSGNAVAEFTVATDESYKKDGQKVEQTEWHKIKVFGKAAEFAANWIAKGKLVHIVGTIRTRSWEQDGQKRYMTEIVVSGPMHKVSPIEWPDKDAQNALTTNRTPQGGQRAGNGNRTRQSADYAQKNGIPEGMDDVPF